MLEAYKEPHGSIYDVDETEVDVFSLEPDSAEMTMLWARQTAIAQKMFDYYQPWLSAGKTRYNRYRGKVFTDKQLKVYKEVEDKFPVQPRLMKAPIMSLVGHIMNSRRSGQIVTEGGSLMGPSKSEDLVEIGNIMMNDLETKTEEPDKTRDLLHDALVTCYPVWALYDKTSDTDGITGRVALKILPWDSTATGPFNWKELGDINELCYVDYVKETDLIRQIPEMKDTIKKHRSWKKPERDALLSRIDQWEGVASASDRDMLYWTLSSGMPSAMAPDGYFELYTRLFQVEKEEEVAINLLNSDDIIVRSPDWDTDRWNQIISENAQQKNVRYSKVVRPVVLLWVTKFTTSGLVVDCRKHWFQKDGRIPGAPFVPAMADGIPTGPGDDYSELVLKAAVAETEFLDAIRKSGKLLVLRSGYIENITSIGREANKNVGVVIVKKEAPQLENVIKDIDRKPSTVMGEYSQKLRMDMEYETRINSAMQGNSNPSQADVAKQTEIQQGLIVQSVYIRNVNRWWNTIQNIKCKILPYAYDVMDVLEMTDQDTGNKKQVAINYPVRDMTGAIKAVLNDVKSCDFRYKMAPVDDSATAKQLEWAQTMIFLNSVPGPILSGDPTGMMLANFMIAMGAENRYLKQGGQILKTEAEKRSQQQQQLEQQKAQMENDQVMQKLKNEADRNKRQGVNLSFTGEDLKTFPDTVKFLQAIGFFDVQQQLNQAQPGPAEPVAPEQQPQPVPQQ